MKNKKNHSLGNRGSGIVTVLIGVMFTSILGAMLLYTAYTGYQMKMAERSGKVSFYSAESAMNEIKAGIHKVVTQTITEAYKSVLVSYSSSTDTDAAFKAAFKAGLIAWKNDDGEMLFTSRADGGRGYSRRVIEGFISHKNGVTLTCDGNAEIGAAGDTVGIRGVQVEYEGGGTSSIVKTDFIISVPAFRYSKAEYSISGIPEFSIIANSSLDLQIVPYGIGVEGNVYAGEINSSVVGGDLSFSGGNVICGGAVNNRQGRISFAPAYELWSKRLNIGENGEASFSGDTYVADDLELSGKNASVRLAGRYYGFGYPEEENVLAGTANAEGSSSVIINGLNSAIDMKSLTSLMLAGQSFISSGSAGGSRDVIMGQSVSIKSDQLAYLVPQECLSVPSNPHIFTGSAPEVSVDYDYVLWTEGTKRVRLGDYISSIRPLYTKINSGTHNLVYYFMKFNTKDEANNYFRDYFTHKADSAKRYFDMYVSAISAAQSTQSSGNTYYKDGQVLKLLSGSNHGMLKVSAGRLSEMYSNLRVTLTSAIEAPTGVTEPYDYVINSSEMAGLPSGVTSFYDGGEIRAVVAKGRVYKTSEAVSTVKIIICDQGVIADAPFKGLIIAKGSVKLSRSIERDQSGVSEALRSIMEGGDKAFLKLLNIEAEIGSGGGAPEDVASWNPESLVYFENWKKQ